MFIISSGKDQKHMFAYHQSPIKQDVAIDASRGLRLLIQQAINYRASKVRKLLMHN